MKRTLTQKLGQLGVLSFLSYTTAVVFAPLAYPGYNWMSQAVSDLSAANAPSLALWNQLSAFYNVCEVVRNRRLHWHTGAEDKAAAHRYLSVCHYGVGICDWLSNVPAFGQRLCRDVSGRYAHGRHR